jgi:hypothetical protein
VPFPKPTIPQEKNMSVCEAHLNQLEIIKTVFLLLDNQNHFSITILSLTKFIGKNIN